MRSFLFVPADSEKKFAKSPAAGANVLLLDLEDSVAVERKQAACAMFERHTYAGSSDRLAGLMWGAEDLAADIGAIGNRRADGGYEAPFALARSLCLLAAAAAAPDAGVVSIDGKIVDRPHLLSAQRILGRVAKT